MVRRTLLALAAVAFVAWTVPVFAEEEEKAGTHEGKIVKIEAGKLTMSDKDGKNEHTHAIPADAKITEEPVVRRSPARCLVQLGPVALTVAWLQRAQGTVADGELLIVVWRGEVAVRTPQGFERAHQHSGATSATALWETVLMVSAQSETQWGWAPAVGGDAVSSAALARHCVDRLRAAHAECAP